MSRCSGHCNRWNANRSGFPWFTFSAQPPARHPPQSELCRLSGSPQRRPSRRNIKRRQPFVADSTANRREPARRVKRLAAAQVRLEQEIKRRLTGSVKEPEKAALTSVADPVPSPTVPGASECPQLRCVEESACSATSAISAPGTQPSPEAM